MLDALAALTKALLYAGVLASSGPVFAEASLRAVPGPTEFLARVTRGGALLTIAACAAGAFILILRLGGQFDEATLSAVFMSSSGAATSLQLAGAVLILGSVSSDPQARGTRLSYAAIATGSFAFSGHAAAVGPTEGFVAFLHVSAVAWWVGSLLLLLHACARCDAPELAQLIRRFSAIVTSFIGALVIAGLILILGLVDFSEAPQFSPYEQMLAVKIGIAIVVLAAAGYNRFAVTPRLLSGDSSAASALRRMICIELALIGAILATTAILTTYVSPHE